jgi:hypothetical protein
MVHLAIATREITTEEFPCDIIGPFYYRDDIVRQSLPINPGEARPNAIAGLGVELDEGESGAVSREIGFGLLTEPRTRKENRKNQRSALPGFTFQ